MQALDTLYGRFGCYKALLKLLEFVSSPGRICCEDLKQISMYASRCINVYAGGTPRPDQPMLYCF